MKIKFNLEHRQKLDLKHELLLGLRQKIELKLGNLEKQIFDKVEFVDIKLGNDEENYHSEMFREL